MPTASSTVRTPSKSPGSVKLENTVVTPQILKPHQRTFTRLDKTVLRDAVIEKLSDVRLPDHIASQVEHCRNCGHSEFYRICECCGRAEELPDRCSVRWCPLCNWSIAKKRQDQLRYWSERIAQPKHVVLTQRNFDVLSARKIREHQANLSRIRRTRCFANLRGGCISVEITNGGDGWHLHSHWLVDCDWVDTSWLSISWGELCGQEFGIVKVKDARPKDYRAEVAKYVCKPSEMLEWTPNQLAQFLTAIHRSRFFFRFGSLFKLKQPLPERRMKLCECGESAFVYDSGVKAFLKHHVTK